MLDILEFIFENPYHFIGFSFLWCFAWSAIACIGRKEENNNVNFYDAGHNSVSSDPVDDQ